MNQALLIVFICRIYIENDYVLLAKYISNKAGPTHYHLLMMCISHFNIFINFYVLMSIRAN